MAPPRASSSHTRPLSQRDKKLVLKLQQHFVDEIMDADEDGRASSDPGDVLFRWSVDHSLAPRAVTDGSRLLVAPKAGNKAGDNLAKEAWVLESLDEVEFSEVRRESGEVERRLESTKGIWLESLRHLEEAKSRNLVWGVKR